MAPFLARMMPDLREKITQQLSVSAEKARADRAGFTRLSFDPGHGTQVTYSTPDGRIYLWYPGNTVILPGKWEAREKLFGMRGERGNEYAVPYGDICFWYATNALNPITRQPGSQWACGAAGRLEKYLIETRKGDILGLEKRQRPPFILEKERTSLDALLARIHGRQ